MSCAVTVTAVRRLTEQTAVQLATEVDNTAMKPLSQEINDVSKVTSVQ